MGPMCPQAPDAWRGREEAAVPERPRARLPAPTWGQVSGLLPQPSLRCGSRAGGRELRRTAPARPAGAPVGWGQNTLFQIPASPASLRGLPPPPPAPGTLGKAPGAAPASTAASKLDALWATPVPEDSPGWPAPSPRTPSPSPVTGPSQYTWMYSSKLCPEQRKVTEAASVGFRKADVRGPAAEKCRRQSWPACATSPLDPPPHLGGLAPPPVPTGTRGGGRPAQARG